MNALGIAKSLNEVKYYLMVRPCPACGKGPRSLSEAALAAQAGQAVVAAVHCARCGQSEELSFRCEHACPADGPGAETINPAAEPSRLVDLSQWLSLFYLLLESSWRAEGGPAVRQDGFRAALCLAEALKFYGDDELPPARAFFSPEGQAAFRDHPEKFARQRLRDMQSRLPSLPRMAQRTDRDKARRRRRWWQFWKPAHERSRKPHAS